MGPTASGKSELAIHLAECFSGEIISADSMQAYKGLDIGTAKPAPEEMKKIKHHLINILEIHEPLNVFKYKELAERAVCEIRKRGKLPIIAGGSGMYLKALIDGLDPLPSDKAISLELDKKFSGEEGFKSLCLFLKEKSEEDFHQTYPNRRRMLRIAEIIILTGKAPKELKTKWAKSDAGKEKICFVIKRERDDLKRRIKERTEKMLSEKWVEETENLIRKGLLNSPTARQAIGYKIIAKYIAGQINCDEMKAEIISATWKLARRQESWFRNRHKDAISINMPAEKEKLFQWFRKPEDRSHPSAGRSPQAGSGR
jgi:tRNA dimethylallyltransferase